MWTCDRGLWLFDDHDRDWGFFDDFLADAADQGAFEEAEATAAHDDEVAMLFGGDAHDGFRDVAGLDVLGCFDVVWQFLPDAVEDDVAWDVFVDVAGDVDEVEVGFALLGEEDCFIDGFAAVNGTVDWY